MDPTWIPNGVSEYARTAHIQSGISAKDPQGIITAKAVQPIFHRAEMISLKPLLYHNGRVSHFAAAEQH